MLRRICRGKLPEFMTGRVNHDIKADPNALDVYQEFDDPPLPDTFDTIPDPFQLRDSELHDIQLPTNDKATMDYDNRLANPWSAPKEWTKEGSGRPDGKLPFGMYDLAKRPTNHPMNWTNGPFQYTAEKNPYGVYDDPWDRRNYGDPLHEDDDVITSFAPTMHHQEHTNESTWDYLKAVFGSGLILYGVYYLFDQHKYWRGLYGMDYPVMKKQFPYPHDGIFSMQLDGKACAEAILSKQ